MIKGQMARRAASLGVAGGPPVPSLDRLSNEQIKKLESGRYADALRWRFHQKVRFVAGTAIPVTAKSLFKVPFGAPFSAFNDATVSYQQTKRDTNITQAGTLPQDQEFWLYSIEVAMLVTGGNATTYSNGVPVNPVPTAAVDGINLAVAVLNDGVLTNNIAGKPYEEDNLIEFPYRYSISAAAGAGATTDHEVLVQNSGNRDPELDIWHTINGGDSFGPDLQFYSGIIPNVNFELDVTYRGLLFRSVR